MAGIYIHIPFCKQACHYCDFHFSTSLRQKENLVDALNFELVLRHTALANQVVNTVYFGGGTPSLLTTEEISRLLETISQYYKLSAGPEITLEANPDDINPAALLGWQQAGVNRLSIGIQSFDDATLKWMNRVHKAQEASDAVKLAQQAGFDNISIDLIYGIPNLTDEQWQQQLDIAFGLGVQHISTYCLTIEPKTVFGNWHKKGELLPAPDDEAAQQFLMLTDMAHQKNWNHYEIASLCVPGFKSRHNSSYWQQEPYLGVGPAAHSYDGYYLRRYNISHNTKYIKALQAIQDGKKAEDWFTKELLSEQDRANDYLLTTIRVNTGVGLSTLEDLNYFLLKEKSTKIALFEEQEICYIKDNHLILTNKGRLLADAVTAELMK